MPLLSSAGDQVKCDQAGEGDPSFGEQPVDDDRAKSHEQQALEERDSGFRVEYGSADDDRQAGEGKEPHLGPQPFGSVSGNGKSCRS